MDFPTLEDQLVGYVEEDKKLGNAIEARLTQLVKLARLKGVETEVDWIDPKGGYFEFGKDSQYCVFLLDKEAGYLSFHTQKEGLYTKSLFKQVLAIAANYGRLKESDTNISAVIPFMVGEQACTHIVARYLNQRGVQLKKSNKSKPQ